MMNDKKPFQRKLGHDSTREKALYLLEMRAHSRKELIDKLIRVTTRSTAQAVVDELSDVGLIDDEAFALQFAHDIYLSRMVGPNKLKRELMLKGIDPDTAQRAMDYATEELGSFEDTLDKLIERKYLSRMVDDKGVSKVVASLYRAGYGYDMIKKALRKILENDPEKEGLTHGL